MLTLSHNGHSPRVGRPSKFTPERIAAIIADIEGGNFLNTAARGNGVSYKVFREWMLRGKSDAPQDRPFREFREDVIRATAKAEMDAVRTVKRAMVQGDDWRAAMAFLERRHAQRFAKLTRQDVRIRATSVICDLASRTAFLSDPAIAAAVCARDEREAAPRALQGPSVAGQPATIEVDGPG